MNNEYRNWNDEVGLLRNLMDRRNEHGHRIYDLDERLVGFAVCIMKLIEGFPRTSAGIHIAGQLVRCGTSPAANYGEAQSAESRSDFIHKMKLALKELRETRVWLLIVQRQTMLKPNNQLEQILMENNELISIFVASIATAQKKR